MCYYSKTTLRELKKRYLNILKKCFLINMGLLLCTTTAFAESAYIMKETGVGGLLVPEYDSNTNTLTNKYYEIDLKNKSYGNDDVSRTYQVEILGQRMDILVNFDPATSRPREAYLDGDISGLWMDIYTTWTNKSMGGAYDNYYGGLNSLTGNFINNTLAAGGTAGGAYGTYYGWDIQKITANFIANGVVSSGNALGGAIYNHENLGAPEGDFIANYAKGDTGAYGGAIYNQVGYSDKVHSNFIENYAQSKTGFAIGGAIWLNGYEFDISGDFLGNKALSESGEAIGGALYIAQPFGNLESAFIGNIAKSESNASSGGAIYNEATLNGTKGLFLYNQVEGTTALGGAIFNTGEIKNISASFIGNIANAKEDAIGGAIYNADTGSLVVKDSQFFYNKALAEEGTALGGAIHNEGQITFKGHNIFAKNNVNNTLNDIHNEGEILVEGTLVTSSGLTGDGSVTVKKDGVLDIQTSQVQMGQLTVEEGGTLKVVLKSLEEHGKVLGNVDGSGKLNLNMGVNVEPGQYKIFEQDTNMRLSENKLFNIQDMNDGRYDISKKTVSELSETLNIKENAAKTLSAIVDKLTTHQEFAKIQEEIFTVLSSNEGESSQKVKKALTAIGTSEQAAAQSVSTGHAGAVGKVVGGEMKGGAMGRAGGEEMPRAKVYIKGLYDKTKSTMGEGFKARSKGAVLGVQSEVTDALTLGVGYATSQTTAKEDLRRTEVDTNTGFISAHYQPNAWWLSGLATYSRGQYDEQKQVLSSVGTANYDVDSWGVQMTTGYDIKIADAVITPEVGLHYLSVKQEGYTDTLGTTVEATTSDYLTAIAGVKGAWDLGVVRPTVGFNVGYDVITDDVATLNTLANGTSYTVNGEALDRLNVGVEAGVEGCIGERTTLKLEYNGSFRKEYQDHSGMLKLELKF